MKNIRKRESLTNDDPMFTFPLKALIIFNPLFLKKACYFGFQPSSFARFVLRESEKLCLLREYLDLVQVKLTHKIFHKKHRNNSALVFYFVNKDVTFFRE